MYSTHQKGEVALLRTALRAIEKGFRPSRPLIEGRYDLVVDDGAKLHRVQVKYGAHRASTANAVEVDLRKQCYHHGPVKRYRACEVDAVVVYVPSREKFYWLPPALFDGRACVTLRFATALNRQRSRTTPAENFEW